MARRPTTLIGTQTNIRFVSLVGARKVPETHTEKFLCEIPIDAIVLYVWQKKGVVGGKQKATQSHQWAQEVQEAIPELIPKLSRLQDRLESKMKVLIL